MSEDTCDFDVCREFSHGSSLYFMGLTGIICQYVLSCSIINRISDLAPNFGLLYMHVYVPLH